MLALHKIYPIAFLLLFIVAMLLLPPLVSGIAVGMALLGLVTYISLQLPAETFKYLAQFCGQFLGLLFVVGVFSGGMALLSSMMLA